MKQFVIAGAVVCCGLFRTWSQVALTVGAPAISVGAPAISPSSPVFVVGSPAIPAPIVTPTPSGTRANVTLQALSDALIMLQTNLEQTLPLVAGFNDNFDFISLSDNGVASTTAGNPSGNFGVSFASNQATNLAVNLGVDAAMPTGPGLFNTAQSTVAASAAGSAQGLSAVSFTRNTLRALLILQGDIEHMLTVVNVLNTGATNAGTFTNVLGVAQ